MLEKRRKAQILASNLPLKLHQPLDVGWLTFQAEGSLVFTGPAQIPLLRHVSLQTSRHSLFFQFTIPCVLFLATVSLHKLGPLSGLSPILNTPSRH